MKIHAGARGFDKGAEAYERGRPEYPAAAIGYLTEHLRLTAGATVVDLGAGTGKLSRLLGAAGARVIGIEPVEGMRRKFAEVLPAIPIIEGTAESIPLATAAADAAAAGQAFHWFANAEALAEIHRVLKPHGRLGLIWNLRDASTPWIAELWRIVDRYEGDSPRSRDARWKRAFAQFSGFRQIAERAFEHVQRGDVRMVLDRVASLSFIASLPDSARAEVLRAAREVVERQARSAGGDTVELPYRTVVYIYESV